MSTQRMANIPHIVENAAGRHAHCRSKKRRRQGGHAMKIQSRLLFATIAGALAISVPAFAEGPEFKVDASWPKQLPNNWIIGQIGGMNVDAQDHIWVFQRPRSLKDVDLAVKKQAKCCVAAPSVIEFDAAGNVVSSWGGPGYNPDWP